MNKAIVILIILVVIVFGVGAYFIFSNNNNSYQTPTDTSAPYPAPASGTSDTGISASTTTQVTSSPAPTTPAPTTPAPSAVTVSIKNFAFGPATLNIKVGTKVTWVNNDSAPHTVTSDSGSLLNSSTLSPGQSFSFTFTSSGSTSYHCAIHPMMHGTVVVTN